MTVGAATLAKAMAQSCQAAVAFLCGFYLLLVGSKVLVVLLAFFGFLLFREGWKQLG